MPPKNQRRKHLKKLYSFPVFLIMAVLTVTTMRAVYRSFERYHQEDRKVNNAIEDLTAMEEREKNLKAENDWLKTERGQEELFREQYMIAKEGENVIVITDKDAGVEHTVTTETKDNSLISKTKKMIGVRE